MMPSSTPLPVSALIHLDPTDNVLVAIRSLVPGEIIDGLTIMQPIPFGHKVAARDIGCREKIFKWGAPIGSATCAIAAGEHVHLHNMQSDYLPTFTLEDGIAFLSAH